MDDNLNWTTDLGQAFLNQQPEVMESIQRLRQSASNVGNLQSTPQQQVVNDGGDIEIVPADPQVIYVPVYQPDQVYYQTAYGSPFVTFGIGWPIGLWLNCDFDWGRHNLIAWGRDHPRPSNWWREPAHERDMGHTTVWHSNNHPRTSAVNRGDRGYGVPHNQPVVATVGRSRSDSVAPRRTPAPAARPEAPATRASMPVARSTPAPVQRSQSGSRPASTSAFIGIQSSRDTKTYSNRGQQSMQTVTRSAPAPRPAPVSRPAPSSSGGGGGGGHSSNSQPRH
jgi:hypothetical protein